MSVLDWFLLVIFISVILGFAALGLVKAISTGIGIVVAFFVATPLLAEPLANLLGLGPSLLNLSPDQGFLRGIAVLLLVALGAALGGVVGDLISWPVEIIPGINLMNTLGGAAIGLVVGLVALGVAFAITALVTPGWVAAQLGQSSWFSTLVAQNIGRLALLLAPADFKSSLELLKVPTA